MLHLLVTIKKSSFFFKLTQPADAFTVSDTTYFKATISSREFSLKDARLVNLVVKQNIETNPVH